MSKERRTQKQELAGQVENIMREEQEIQEAISSGSFFLFDEESRFYEEYLAKQKEKEEEEMALYDDSFWRNYWDEFE